MKGGSVVWMSLAFGGVDLATLVPETVARVEEVAGRTFSAVPEVRWVDTAGISGVVAQETAGLQHLIHPTLTADELRTVAREVLPTAPGLLGKYGLFDQTLYLNRQTLRAQVRASKADGVDTDLEAITRCVLAHELAHALHAQTGAFERVAQLRDQEALLAMNAVSEGFASQVHQEVCEPGLGARISELVGTTRPETPYGAGYALLEHAGASERWSILEHPPATTRALVEHDARGKTEPAVDPAPTMQALSTLVKGSTVGYRASYHELAHGLASDPAARIALASLVSGTTARGARARGRVQLDVLAFPSPEAAHRFLGSTRSVRPPTLDIPTWVEEPEAFDAGEEGYHAGWKLVSTRGGSLDSHRWVARSGSRVAVLTSTQAGVPAGQAREVLAAALGPVAAD